MNITPESLKYEPTIVVHIPGKKKGTLVAPEHLPGAEEAGFTRKMLEDAKGDWALDKIINTHRVAMKNAAAESDVVRVGATRYVLYEMYATGDGIEQDAVKSAYWLAKAAAIGDCRACAIVGRGLVTDNACGSDDHLKGVQMLLHAVAGAKSNLDEATVFAGQSYELLCEIAVAIRHEAVDLGRVLCDLLLETKAPTPCSAATSAKWDTARDRLDVFDQDKLATGRYVRVILDPIPPSTGREGLEQYEPLRRAVPLAPVIGLDRSRAILEGEFPWMVPVIERIFVHLEGRQAMGGLAFKLPPILLHSGPGTGKTRLINRLGELCGVPFIPHSAAGDNDSMLLRGSTRGWESARPSLILMNMLRDHCANPLLFVDEIDKAATSRRNGSIQDVMLGLTESTNSRTWADPCLLTRCDLSHVSVIAAANDLTFLPGPLRSRFEIIEVPTPRREHMVAVIRATVTEMREKEGLSPWLVPDLDSIEVAEIIRAIGANPRRIALATRCWINRKAVHESHRAMH